jgi:hypothetical protein
MSASTRFPYMVVKKDGRRERFDRQKVLSGLLRACEKRPVSSSQVGKIVDATESYLMDAPERERTTSEVGELIMQHLKGPRHGRIHPLCIGLSRLQGCARVQGRAGRVAGEPWEEKSKQLVFRLRDLVMAHWQVRAWTPARQPVWRPALHFCRYRITRSQYQEQTEHG